jgi:membrane protein DedA with SNARE-associated domain
MTVGIIAIRAICGIDDPRRRVDAAIMPGVELAFLLRHGYAVLLAAGALAGMGKLDFAAALLATLLACGLSDAFWFELGRRRGIKVLRLLCRLSA